jgi:hypothetical protein
LPLVNLIYRHLAVEPGRLEGIWESLRIPRSALVAVGVDDQLMRRVLATLEAYNYANPRNLLAIHALLGGSEGAHERAQAAGAPQRHFAPAELLPMADLRSVGGQVRALLEEMSQDFAAPGETILIPSLFRHFAHNPGLLALLWVALRPCIEHGTFADRVAVVAQMAPALARSLPFPVRRIEDASTRAALQRFTDTVPRMIVAGGMMQQALNRTSLEQA